MTPPPKTQPSPLPRPIDNIHRREAAWLTGVIRGCARGLLAGRRHALRDVIEARFGPLSAHDRAHIDGIQPADLTRCLKRAATSRRLDDVWRADRDDDTEPAPPALPDPDARSDAMARSACTPSGRATERMPPLTDVRATR